MYSFNLDYVFNLVYNCFLAIRYAIIFWILRIPKEQYLIDHQYDTWDGLRDRGWLTISTSTAKTSTDNVIYLGQVANEQHSKAGEIIQQVKSVPWFYNLHFSIQNPILAFLADVLSVLTFFILLLLIYILIRWLAIVLSPINENKNKLREEKLQKRIEMIKRKKEREREKIDKVNLEREVQDQIIEKKSNSNKVNLKIEETKIENIIETLPAGIPNLPIDESDLSVKEIESLENQNDILLNYEVKNIIPKKENKILKVNLENKDKEVIKSIAIPAESINKNKRDTWYKERWEIILGYMRGEEDALWRIGIIEADNLLNTILIEKGYTGLTLSDKLSQASFKSIDLAWSAHKIRNRIAHDGMQFVLTDRIAKSTIESFRAVFKELKVID